MVTRAAFALVLTLPLSVAAGAKDVELSTVKFVVLRDYNGKPVRNASVVIHALDKKGNQKSNWGQQLKTDADGKAQHPAVPYGNVRVQVIAPGLQTHGADYVIDKGEQEIVIKLKRPQEQHSIYKSSPK